MDNLDISSRSEERTSPRILSTPTGEGQSGDFQKRILEAFEVFDHEHSKTVDVREIGTIIRSLGYCPSEAELQGVLRDMEDPKQVGVVHLDRFLPVMSKIIMQQKFQPESLDSIYKAFQALDPEGKGELTADELRQIFTEQGEKFASDEMEEMLNAAVDQSTGTIIYKNFAHFLVVDDD